MPKQFIWEKFIDPLNRDIEKEEEEYDEDSKIHAIQPLRILKTPFGLLSVTPQVLAVNQFDLWILHTNFDIEPKHVATLNIIPGIESLEVISRYRFRIGFPNTGLFDVEEIKQKILVALRTIDFKENLILNNLLLIKLGGDAQKFEEIMKLRNNIAQEEKYWLIYILPNKELEYFTTDDMKEFQDKYNYYSYIYSNINGQILSSLDYTNA